MNRKTTHRRDTGRSHGGQPIHAAPGVHEHAAHICQIAFPKGARVLEVGAGSGALALRLQELAFRVTPSDLDPAHGWIRRLDLDDHASCSAAGGPFDMVICVETVEHLENPRGALRSIRSMLEPGGKLLISTPNITHPHSRLKMLLTRVPILFGSDAYYETGHITLLPDWLLVEHLRVAGFDNMVLERAGDFGIESRFRRFAHRIEMLIMRILGVREATSSGDGACLFILATAV
jgi:SAM-dependent methyltransferase